MLFDEGQREALNRLRSGNILCGDVGSGKSRTALAYYFEKECGGSFEPLYSPMRFPKDLYIITTAKKRDSLEWDEELVPFNLSRDKGLCDINITIDSWNNIKKYSQVKNSFFIFDEQRLVGSGAWVDAFYQITGASKYSRLGETGNHWLLLSATPGDTWNDYIPVFVANKFYKNKTEFTRRHVIFSRYTKYPKVEKYLEDKHLRRLRASILVDIRVEKKTIRHYQNISVNYDMIRFKKVMKDRWNIYKEEPIEDGSQLCPTLRRVVNENEDRVEATKELVERHKKVIIFYNFDYELELLRIMCKEIDIPYAEWNGHNHEQLPTGDRWVYLVQYSAGCEGWNCITTNVIIYYSLNYSYRMTMQAAGRIDRRNTSYIHLYYYFLKTNSWIDRAIMNALVNKKDFNERSAVQKVFG